MSGRNTFRAVLITAFLFPTLALTRSGSTGSAYAISALHCSKSTPTEFAQNNTATDFRLQA